MPKASAYLQGIAPKATAHDLNSMMWCCTPYPIGSVGGMRRLRRSLRKYFHLGGNSISGAIGYAHDELDYQFEKHQRYEDPQRAEQSPEPVAPKRYPVRQPLLIYLHANTAASSTAR